MFPSGPPKKQRFHYPPEFWDGLSKIWLEPVRDCSPARLAEIKSLAESEGPDLTDLRSYNVPRSSSSLESSSDTNSETTATTAPSAYAGGFVQHLIDRGVYPHGYHYPNGSRIPKPNNFDDIIQRLGRSRHSLSPSKFSNREFEKLQDADTHPCKSVLVDDSTRILEGDDVSGGYRFVNLAPLTDHRLRAIKPSHFLALAVRSSIVESCKSLAIKLTPRIMNAAP
ncbi:hypothetical protein DPV78_009956 [Talaromyces pinophilus]|nr:hypothetical protein DPV78_009956 [Talaromyces pinophilus]